MKLRTIHVEGFGLLREKTLQLEGPLTVLYGRNEAGKSTLMGFIRAVLFGFPPRPGGAGSLEPLMGAAHGGYLTLETAEGERIRVERREGAPASAGRARSPGGGNVRVTLASGAQGGAELLQPLLGGITGELFRSLFAFSLSELQEVRTLQSDALSGYLYSAGLGARGDTIMAAERKLTSEMEQLFRPRGRNQALNQTLLKLEEQEADVRRSKEQAGRYNEYLAQLAEVEERMQTADLSLREQRTALAWLEAADQARSHWLRGHEIHLALTKLPEFEHFPEEAITRFDHLSKDEEQLWKERDKLQLALQRMQDELDQNTADPALLRHQTELEALYEQLTAFRVNQATEKELFLEIEQQQLQLDRLLRQIDASWNESRLSEYAVTVVHREHVRNWDDRLDKLLREREQSVTEYQRLTLQTEEAKEKASKLEARLSFKQRQIYHDLTLEAQNEMDALGAIVGQLRKQLQQKQQLRLELRHIEQRERDHALLVTNGQAPNHEKYANHSVFRWLTIAVNVVIPLFFILNSNLIGALASFIVLSGVTLGIWYYSLKPVDANRSRRSYQASDASSFPSERAKLEQELIPLEQSLGLRLDHFFGLVQAASAGNPSSKHVFPLAQAGMTDQQTEESLDVVQNAAEAWREAKHELAAEEQRWQEASDAYDKQQKLKQLELAKLEQLDQKHAEFMQEWQSWLVQQQLAPQLSPSGALEVFQMIEAGQQQLQLKQRNEAKRKALLQKISDYEQQSHILLGHVSLEDIPASLKKWKEASDKTIRMLQNQQRLEQQQMQTNSELTLLVESLERVQQRIRDLWYEASAADEQQFRIFVRQQKERTALEEELQQLEAALDVFIGSARKPLLDALLHELSPQELKQRIEEASQALKEQEQSADQLKENRGKFRSELEKLEGGAEHSERLQHMQEQAAVLTEQAAHWAKLAFCSALFRKGRELYERERQPGVMLLATDYFNRITSGEYVRVLVPLGEKKIVVEHRSGRMIDSSLLSRGTAEQLYLAIRFALAEEYASKASLPLILDDIMVNFDQERMQQTIALLAQISAKHQVIFFTCHPHVAEAFSTQLPSRQQIHLN